MALHLVTGYKGTPHITAADVGAFNAGLLGEGEYVLSSGNKLAASLVASNTVRILDGDVVVQGRHISLKKGTYEEVTISNGTTGMNRNDLIVVRYTKDSSTGTENAVFAVIRGTETSGTATDPEYTTGDILSGGCTLHEMPLYRIPLTGVTVGEPEALFESSSSLGGLEGFIYKGVDPVRNDDEDLPNKWRELGVGAWDIKYPASLNGALSQSGTLINCCENRKNMLTQMYIAPNGVYYRYSGNSTNYWAGNDSLYSPWIKLSETTTKWSSYDGGDFFGKNNPNYIDCPFVPRVIIIRNGFSTLTWIYGMDWAGWLSPSGEQKSVSTSREGNRFYWYSVNDAGEQMNAPGETYYYIAIGGNV